MEVGVRASAGMRALRTTSQIVCRPPRPLTHTQAIMLAVVQKLTYDDEYNFDNEVR